MRCPLQELNAKNEDLEKTVEELMNRLNDLDRNSNSLQDNPENEKRAVQKQSIVLTGIDDPYLGQNVPNPFVDETRIDYYIPESLFCGNESCRITFYDRLGRIIYESAISASGYGTINVSTKNLAEGVYTYTLLVKGKVIETKNMVFQK
ncbi:MAG TPA: hypothetical protein VFG10_13840 [Saprospiraceae bacterium]|nr:hypothetical protein [Saprospiraceae bacterium]